jgi:hypothetical protein
VAEPDPDSAVQRERGEVRAAGVLTGRRHRQQLAVNSG